MLVEEERRTFIREHHRNTRQVRPKLLQQLFSDMFKETFHVNYFVSDIILTFLLYFFYLVERDAAEGHHAIVDEALLTGFFNLFASES